MPEEKTCAYESEKFGYKCTRSVWKDGGPDEKYCLFHSEQYEKKKVAFKREIDKFKRWTSTEYLLGGKRSEIEIFDFLGFRFPEGCSGFGEHKFNESVDFREATFNGATGFEGARFSSDAWFCGAKFIRDVRFDEAIFSGDAWFGEAEFNGEAVFTDVKFAGIAEFVGVTFIKDAKFDEVIFDGNAWFGGAKFSGDARFDDTKFNSISWLGGAVFRGNAWFFETIFGGYTRFGRAIFYGNAVFYEATFKSLSSFEEATFSGDATFEESTFDSDFWFSEASIGDEAGFEKANFSGIAGFKKTEFRGDAVFEGAIFGDEALFEEARFSSEAVFEEATFGGSAGFDGAIFSAHARFGRTTFSGFARFSKVTFGGEAEFDIAKFNGVAEFERTRFSSLARFSRVTFGSVAGFVEAIFLSHVVFTGAAFGSDACFAYANFNGGAQFQDASFIGEVNFEGTTFSISIWFARATIGGDAVFKDVFSKGTNFFFGGALIKKNLIISTRPETGCLPASLSFDSARIIGNLYIEDSEIERIKADNLIYRRVLSLRNVVIRNDSLEQPSTFENVYLERAKFINLDLSTVAMGGPFIREVIFDRIRFGEPDTKEWKHSSQWLGRPNEAIYEERLARACKDNEKRNKFGAAETVYRTLKHEMEKQHAKGLARRMRAGELECKLQGEPGFSQKVILLGYRFLNGFGLRWIRAGLIWLTLIFIFAGGYFFLGGEATFDEYDTNTKRYETIKIEQIDLGYAIRHSFETATVLITQKHRMDSWLADLMEILQRILCTSVFLLFLQAARNAARD